MLFINRETGEEFEVDPQDENAARQEGLTRAYTFKDKGEEVIVPEDKLNEAQESGLKATSKDMDEISGVEAGLRGLGSSLSFGLSDEALGALKAGVGKLKGSEESFADLYQKERDLERLRNEAAYEEQMGFYGAGFAGGLIGNPLASLGRGAAKLIGRGLTKESIPSVAQIAGKGAIGGATAGVGGGAGLGGPDIVGGEPGEAGALAAQIGIGAATGGALGGALGKVAQKGRGLAEDVVDEAKENVILKSIGYHTQKPRTILKKAGIKPEDLARDMETRGVMEGVKKTDDVIDNLNKLAREDAGKIGETIKDIDAVTKTGKNPDAFLESIIQYRQNVRKALLDPKKTASQDIVKTERLVRDFTKGIDKKFLGGNTPKQLAELSEKDPTRFNKIVNRLKNQGFDDLYREKSAIGRAIRELRGKSDIVQAEKAGDIQKVLMDTIEGHVRRNAPDQAQAQSLLGQLAKNRRDMLFSRTAKNIAEESAEREAKNRQLSLTDIIAGGSVASGLGASLGPAGIPLGFALGTGASKYARTRGLGAAYAPIRGAEKTLEKGAFEKAAKKLTRSGVIAGGAASGEE